MGSREGLAQRQVHGVSFEEAKELFTTEAEVLEIYDAEHSHSEDRFKSIGPISRGLVLVVWTKRVDEVIRIITARWATDREAGAYRASWRSCMGRGTEASADARTTAAHRVG